MSLTPDQLRQRISNNKLRCIAVAVIAGSAWLGSFVLAAKLHGPFGPAWMLPLVTLFLIGGIAAIMAPTYLLNRRYGPRCTACNAFLSDERRVDLNRCPRCHAPLVASP